MLDDGENGRRDIRRWDMILKSLKYLGFIFKELNNIPR